MIDQLRIETPGCSQDVARIDFKEKGVEWALRVSPHYYNTEDEVMRLKEALQQEFPR